jgi:hypothetical protein
MGAKAHQLHPGQLDALGVLRFCEEHAASPSALRQQRCQLQKLTREIGVNQQQIH